MIQSYNIIFNQDGLMLSLRKIDIIAMHSQIIFNKIINGMLEYWKHQLVRLLMLSDWSNQLDTILKKDVLSEVTWEIKALQM